MGCNPKITGLMFSDKQGNVFDSEGKFQGKIKRREKHPANIQELRRGNIIGYELGNGQFQTNTVKEIRKDMIAISDPSRYKDENGEWQTGQSFMKLKGVEFVPITKERLCEIGFDIESLEDFYDDVETALLYDKPGTGESITITLDKGKWYFGLGYQDYHREVKYMHTVQNLYFFLFDKELKK